jgi:hypothetical protein
MYSYLSVYFLQLLATSSGGKTPVSPVDPKKKEKEPIDEDGETGANHGEESPEEDGWSFTEVGLKSVYMSN